MESPVTVMPKSRPRSHRKPLQPKNPPATTTTSSGGHLKHNSSKNITKPAIRISPIRGDSDKENRPFPAVVAAAGDGEVGPLDASLAEELGAARRRRERLRSEKEKTEEVLKERDTVLEREMERMERRGEVLKKVELEIKRFIRSSPSSSSRPSSSSSPTSFPFQSLREKEREKNKRAREAQAQGMKHEGKDITSKESDPSPSKDERLTSIGKVNVTTESSKQRTSKAEELDN